MVDVVQGILMDLGLPIIAAIVSILAGVAVKKLNDWLNWKILKEYKGDIEDLAYKAVMLSKKQTRKWAKEQGKNMDEDTVVARALEWLHKQSPELEPEEARDYVESALEFVGLDDEDENGGTDTDKSE